MPFLARHAFLTAACLLGVSVAADAETPDVTSTQAIRGAADLIQTPQVAYRKTLGDAEAQSLRTALDAAKRGDVNVARSSATALSDPIARKLALWALADSAGESLSFFEADQARRDLAGWPRGQRRIVAAEKLLETSGQTPQQIIAWFGGGEPATAQGAMALAAAYRATGRNPDASSLIRTFWREKIFEADAQRAMLARFGDVLTPDDHARRTDVILYGSQGPAARDMLPLLTPERRALAEARMAYRSGAASADDQASRLPVDLARDSGLIFERAAYLRKRGQEPSALALVRDFPADVPGTEAADRIWNERYALVIYALKNGDSQGAYAAAANSGLTSGADAAEAEFYAGWIALTRLKNPTLAETHFSNLEKIGVSPITRGRALYWLGRAAEARGDQAVARGRYNAAAQYGTTFYGQLAGEKVNGGLLNLGGDPSITQADRARFEGRDTVRAARLLYELGQKDMFKTFVLTLDDVLPSAEEEALLVDLVRGYGDQDTSMKVVRAAAQRGFVLPQRGYPYRTPPSVIDAPEPALVLGITRQESGFDPMVRSGSDARGMMQLLPSTAALVARKTGATYSAAQLWDPDYNMRLGSSYLGHTINTFSGSYVMGVAAYNAGPGRPAQWVSFCGDPRTSSTDPIDFIECIPFSETRNYVMRVMEGMQVYRARQNGGSAPITLSADLARGSYRYPATTQAAAVDPLGDLIARSTR